MPELLSLEDPKQLVLALIAANQGYIEGRTVLQKLSYFTAEHLQLSLGFKPHYYGPFSSEIENATELLRYSGLVRELSETIPVLDPSSDFESRKYHYHLTDKGKQYLQSSGLKELAGFQAAKSFLESMRGLIDFKPSVLSAAAKIHYIVSAEGQPITTEEIRDKATGVGWELTQDEIDEVGELLVRLGLLRTTGN